MAILLSSDEHFGHTNVLTHGPGRPFASIEEHDEALIENWNRAAKTSDTVIIVGDFTLSVTAMERVVPRLNGRKILYAGNHDLCWEAHPGEKKRRAAPKMRLRYLAAGFAEVHGSGQGLATIAGIDVMIAHLPADGDHFTEQRYPNQRPQPGALPLLCGHVHHLWATSGRQINVGVDHWDYTPVHEDALAAAIAELPPYLGS